MSIIYDALQKTQKNREYFRVQNALTPIKTPRRKKKWVFLGGSILLLGAGILGAFSFYALARHAALSGQAVVKKAVPVVTQGEHFWVTDSNKLVIQPAAPVASSVPATSTPTPVFAAVPASVAPVMAPVIPSAAEDPILASAPRAEVTTLQTPQPLSATPAPELAPQQPVVSAALPQQPMAAAPMVPNTIVGNNLVLNGVMISGTEKVALINNQPFHLGDIVEGLKIIGIEANSVRLQNGNQVIELRISV